MPEEWLCLRASGFGCFSGLVQESSHRWKAHGFLEASHCFFSAAPSLLDVEMLVLKLISQLSALAGKEVQHLPSLPDCEFVHPAHGGREAAALVKTMAV